MIRSDRNSFIFGKVSVAKKPINLIKIRMKNKRENKKLFVKVFVGLVFYYYLNEMIHTLDKIKTFQSASDRKYCFRCKTSDKT